MTGLLFLTIFFLRFQEWDGLVRVLLLVLLVAVPFFSAAITYLYMQAYLLWAVLLTVLYFLGSLVYTYTEGKA
jgi:low temperature requirement protein LtrA